MFLFYIIDLQSQTHWWYDRYKVLQPDKARSDETESLRVSEVRDATLVLSEGQLDRELEVVENNEAALVSLLLLLEGPLGLHHGDAQDGGEVGLVSAGDGEGKFEIFLTFLGAEHRGETGELVVEQQQIPSK